ncbi:kelch domain-containing protein 10 homolog [Microplitis mediator]|uniref:kelch domain-containing protein 10 homolog n=1 Tax=Microplitis mediator TaxID=375433 RepID=UPI00255623D2|nr:kelch domain-containing protein 10 homolog [Microplitis mediator]
MFKFKPFLLKKNPVAGSEKPSARRLILNTNNNNTITFYTYYAVQYVWSYNLSSRQYKLLEAIKYDDNRLPLNNNKMIGITSENNNLIICWMSGHLRSSPFVYLHTWNLITNHAYTVVTNNSDVILKYGAYPRNLIRHGDYYYTISADECYNKGFIFGVYRLHIASNSWECVYDLNELDSDSSPLTKVPKTLICDGKMIYCLVFTESDESLPLCKISGFNLVDSKWYILDTIGDDSAGNSCYPIQRNNFDVTQYKDPDTGDTYGILSGGTNYTDAFSDIWKINLKTLTWTCLGKFGLVLPHPIDFHSTTVTAAGRLVLCGGDYSFAKQNWRNNPTIYSAWLRVPKLTDICWDAVLHYCPDLPLKSEEEITSYGIPIKFFHSRIS